MDQSRKEALAHVLWLGGATDSGKTTVAKTVAERHGWQIYHYDKYDRQHHEILAKDPDRSLPYFGNTMDERWVEPTPEALLQRAIATFKLRFPLMIEDLLSFSAKRPVIAEGFGLLPELIAPLLTHGNQAIWLVSTLSFKRASFVRRGKPSFGASTKDPEKAQQNLFNRDLLLAEMITTQAKSRGFELVEVDGSANAEQLAELVEIYFQNT